MPQGFQERFTYGKPMSSQGHTASGSWNWTGTPLIEYEAVYSYRSGKRSNDMIMSGSYGASVLSGRDLRSSLLARKQYLENFIRDTLDPQVGTSSVVSTTDVGHPFATFKIRTQQPYARVAYSDGGSYSAFWDVSVPPAGLPYPDIQDPFGFLVRTDSAAIPMGKQTYFVWPSFLLAGGANAPTTQQTASLALKNQLGAGLIANTNPYNAKSDLAVTIGELMTGNLPRILARVGDRLTRIAIDWKLETGRELSKHTNPGSEWLALQFGWVPLVNDIVHAVETLYKLHLLLYGASEDTRRHRGGDLAALGRIASSFTAGQRNWNLGSPLASSAITSPYMSNTSGSVLSAPGAPNNTDAVWSKSTHIVADYRFSARFHSGARANEQEVGYLDRALQLLGLDITPATLWNLAPWTWLLDWFSNMGTVAQNLSDLDWSNVLLDYAYLTMQVESTAYLSVKVPSTWTNGLFSSSHQTIAHTITTTEKVREQASPVGFSVSWDGLSPFQLSILAALGMTRGR